MNRLVRDAEKLLRASGLPYELVTAKKHTEVYILGKRVTVLANASHGRNCNLLEQAIRKAKAG